MVRLKAVTDSPHNGVLERAASVLLESGLFGGNSPTLETCSIQNFWNLFFSASIKDIGWPTWHSNRSSARGRTGGESGVLLTVKFEVTEEEADEGNVVGEGALDAADEADAEATDRDACSLELFIVTRECEADEREQYGTEIDYSIANMIRRYKLGELVARLW